MDYLSCINFVVLLICSYYNAFVVSLSVLYFSNLSQVFIWQQYSLVPRSSHHPIFDRLQYAKMEGEALVHFIKMDQAFPLCFCILQAIKNWMMGRPGNEASNSTVQLPVVWFIVIHHRRIVISS